MRLMNPSPRTINPSDIRIISLITFSDASSIFEVQFDGQQYALKLFHGEEDPGYAENGRDLNRFRCESNAYQKLLASGACASGLVPKFYGYIDQIDPALFQPAFDHFADDKQHPKALLLEFLPNAEGLNCVNYSGDIFREAVEGMEAIHKAGVHHQDVHPKNLLLVRGSPDRLVWIDFDVATTFTESGPEQVAYSKDEVELVESFGRLLAADQAEGLPPHTKFY